MGRPAFEPTDEQREQVTIWVASRVPIEGMARRMGLAPKTFRKHFAAQLGLIPANQVATAMPPGTALQARQVAFRPTDEQREQALILAGARLSREEIARKVGVTVDVLEEHFAEELERGPAKCKSDIISSMFYAGKGGNVAAAKVYLLFNGQNDPDGDRPPAPVDQPAPQGLQGKKANATLSAQNAEKGSPFDGLLN